MKWNWGTGITLFYSSFAALMIFMVVKSTGYDHSLVQEDYYAADLAYQQHYDKLENSKRTPLRITHRAGEAQVGLQLTDGHSADIQGEILFFRPSDQQQDFKLPLLLDDAGQQVIPVGHLSAGLWRVKVDWRMEETPYYTEAELIL